MVERICRECRYYSMSPRGIPSCVHPSNLETEPNLVNGQRDPILDCYDMRYSYTTCGAEGKLFMARAFYLTTAVVEGIKFKQSKPSLDI